MSNQTQLLTEAQREMLVHSLRVAAEVYEKHAADIVQIADEQGTKTSMQVYTSLVDIFRKQARDSREIANLVEDSEAIQLLPAEPIQAIIADGYDRVESTAYTVLALRAVGEFHHADKLAETLPTCEVCSGKGMHKVQCPNARPRA